MKDQRKEIAHKMRRYNIERAERAMREQEDVGGREQLKREAVERLMKGEDPEKVAKDLNIPYSTITGWRRKAGFVSKRMEGVLRKREMAKALAQMSAEPRKRREPRPPKEKADKLTKYCYVMDHINYKRAEHGLHCIQYGELQSHFERYKPWMPEDWEKWVK